MLIFSLKCYLTLLAAKFALIFAIFKKIQNGYISKHKMSKFTLKWICLIFHALSHFLMQISGR